MIKFEKWRVTCLPPGRLPFTDFPAKLILLACIVFPLYSVSLVLPKAFATMLANSVISNGFLR